MNRYRTRIKFCGITSVEDANAAVAAGADAIGLNFYPQSKRYVNVELAAAIAQSIPALVTVAGLFVNPQPDLVNSVLADVRIDLLQFHGEEEEAFCTKFGRPYMKACQIRTAEDVEQMRLGYTSAAALLLDAWHPDMPGGSGKTFDWSMLKSHAIQNLVLAGGLDPHNVENAIRQIRPFAVDVSSGIESAPGRKNAGLMTAFSRAVSRADSSLNQTER